MKIRIKGNTLRYRLSKSDVNTLRVQGQVEERTQFSGQELVYGLQRYPGSELSATFTGNAIMLYVPEAMVNRLAETEEVGFENVHGHLLLLLEKDFTCLDNVTEDQQDNYPNPLAEKRK